MPRTRLLRYALPSIVPALLAWTVAPSGLHGQQDMADVVIESQEVADGVYMLTGRGGNIGLSVGEDGAFMIDDQFAPLTDRILAAVAEITPEPVRFVLNTHWHGDHMGGNENMGEAGALIVAHDNVRERLATEWTRTANGQSQTVSPQPDGALPVVTFSESATFHWNGHELHAMHAPHAHTDGDAIIHFRSANVIHMGDVYFNGGYPFVDTSSGGSIDGVIHAMTRVLDMVDEDTRIIPGHGPLSNREELRAHRDMLLTIRDRVRAAMQDGRSLQQILGMGLTAEYDADFGGGFVNAERLLGAVHASLEAAGG